MAVTLLFLRVFLLVGVFANLGLSLPNYIRRSSTALIKSFQSTPGQFRSFLSADSPSGSYTPAAVQCPVDHSVPVIRNATTLGPAETEWLVSRRKAVMRPMRELLTRAKIPGFDADAYFTIHDADLSALPNIAIAMSGGGFRSMLTAAGFLAAADERLIQANNNSEVEWKPLFDSDSGEAAIAGLLQASTYLGGLSGTGWLIGSLFAHGFAPTPAIRDNESSWKLATSLLKSPGTSRKVGLMRTFSYWADVAAEVGRKRRGGWPTSITDFWGRLLSYRLINEVAGGPALTFSSIDSDVRFRNGQTPLPLIVAMSSSPGTPGATLNSTQLEISPWEMGSYDAALAAMAPTRWLGSTFVNGFIPSEADGGRCVRGFDQVGFIMGTTSSMFNDRIVRNIERQGAIGGAVLRSLNNIVKAVSRARRDRARYGPNPFLGINPQTNPFAEADELDLADGGGDLQNLPLVPLLRPQRAVDVIFAVDSSSDTLLSWPNGTALRATYHRSQGPQGDTMKRFPIIPDHRTFVNRGLNNRPTFFGCEAVRRQAVDVNNAANMPLIVYIPNAPYSTFSNTSTFKVTYDDAKRNSMIQNGFNIATQANGTFDVEWGMCVACAVLERSLLRTGTAVPNKCYECYERYCWDGQTDKKDRGQYVPQKKLRKASSSKHFWGLPMGANSLSWPDFQSSRSFSVPVFHDSHTDKEWMPTGSDSLIDEAWIPRESELEPGWVEDYDPNDSARTKKGLWSRPLKKFTKWLKGHMVYKLDPHGVNEVHSESDSDSNLNPESYQDAEDQRAAVARTVIKLKRAIDVLDDDAQDEGN